MTRLVVATRYGLAPLAVVTLAGALVFCSTGSRSSLEASAASAWSGMAGVPAVVAMTRRGDGQAVREQEGAFVVEQARRGGVSARMGLAAHDPFELVLPRVGPLRARRVGASAARGVPIDGAVVYPDAWPHADVAVFSRAGVVEELVAVRELGATIDYELDLPAGWSLVPVASGLVEARDDTGKGRARVRADRAWDAEGTTLAARVWVDGHHVHVEPASWDHLPVVVDPSWETLGSGLVAARASHTATPLSDGTVLFVGGYSAATAMGTLTTPLASVEVFDPVQNTFTAGPRLAYARAEHTATPLLDGRVLVAGGLGVSGNALPSVEIYDPSTRAFTTGVGTLSTPRMGHTATRLADGKVLLIGGAPNAMSTGANSADVFDPSTGQIHPLASLLTVGRVHHTASLLPSGQIVIAGGSALGDIEVYDPVQGTFSDLAGVKLATPRASHVALVEVEASGQFVNFAGGVTPGGAAIPSDEYLSYDSALPPSQQWAVFSNNGCFAGTCYYNADGSISCSCDNAYAAGLALPDRGFVLGGQQEYQFTLGSYVPASTSAVATINYYTSVTSVPMPPLTQARQSHSATYLRDGSVLVAGGINSAQGSPDEFLSSVERFLPDEDADVYTATMSVPRFLHTATPLADGRIFVAGGDSVDFPSTAEIYDPRNLAFGAPLTLLDQRADHVAVLLPDGRVLLVGSGSSTGAEIFDPKSLQSKAVTNSSPIAGCTELTATLLSDGTVLVVGGSNTSVMTNPCAANGYVIDPSAGTAILLNKGLNFPRQSHAAAKLGDGRVLIVGGTSPVGAPVPAVEIFDPAVRKFSVVGGGGLRSARVNPSAVLLDPWTVLVAGGFDPTAGSSVTGCGPTTTTSCSLQSTETIRVSTNPGSTQATFALSTPMNVPRHRHTTTALPDGRIAYVGGDCPAVTYAGQDCPMTAFNSQVEIYDPAQEAFVLAQVGSGPLQINGTGEQSAAGLLPTGDILLTGGVDNFPIAAAELLSIRTAPPDAYAPSIGSLPGSVQAGVPIIIAGSAFAGAVDRSGGTTGGAFTGVPQATWVPLAGGLALGSTIAKWDATRAAWFPPISQSLGPGILFVTVDGAHGAGAVVNVTAGPPGIPCSNPAECANGHCVDGVCCDSACESACMACSAATKGTGTDGKCEAVKDGIKDPRSVCTVSPPCGETGACQAGACATVPSGASCGARGATCEDGGCTLPPAPPPQYVCSGDNQVLLPDDETPCAPYSCDPTTGRCRRSPCGSSADCSSGNACTSGVCAAFSAEAEPSSNGCGVAPGGRTGDLPWLFFGFAWFVRRLRQRQGVHAGLRVDPLVRE